MNKRTMLATLVLSAVAATSFAADNNFIGGTDNVVTNGAKSIGVVGYQNTVGANNAVAFGENNVANGTNSFAGGNDSKAMGRNSFAYGSHAEALTEYTVAIGSQARTTAYDTIAIGNGAYANGESTVVIGRTNTVNAENATVIGSNNGTVESGHGIVVGYNNQVLDNSKEQLVFGSNSKTKGQGAIAVGTHAQSGAIDAMAIGNNTLADNPNAVALGTNSTTDTAVSTASAVIAGKTYNFAGDVADSTVSVGTTDKAGMGGVMNYKRTVTNVAAGRISDTSTDAVNGSQLHATIRAINDLGGQLHEQEQTIVQHSNAIAGNSMAINHLRSNVHDHEDRISVLENAQHAVDNRINGMGQRMNKMGASSAALAGLHPLDFNADDKASYAASYGHYRNANAVAFGAFYRPNERVMLGFGASIGSEPMYTANVAFKFGPGSDYIAESKNKDARIARLERLVNELIARKGA